MTTKSKHKAARRTAPEQKQKPVPRGKAGRAHGAPALTPADTDAEPTPATDGDVSPAGNDSSPSPAPDFPPMDAAAVHDAIAVALDGAAAADGESAAGESATVADSTPTRRKGGWPKGRPRKPRGADGDGEPVILKLSGMDSAGVRPLPRAAMGLDADPVRANARLQREVASLRAANADLTVRNDENVHRMVKSSLTGLTLLVGKILARRLGDHMTISTDEATDVGEHVGTALIPFLGDMSKYVPWVAAIGSIAAIAIPRMEIENEIAAGLRLRSHTVAGGGASGGAIA